MDLSLVAVLAGSIVPATDFGIRPVASGFPTHVERSISVEAKPSGASFTLGSVASRAALHELHVPRLLDLHNRSRVGKHLDLFDQLKRGASPAHPAQSYGRARYEPLERLLRGFRATATEAAWRSKKID